PLDRGEAVVAPAVVEAAVAAVGRALGAFAQAALPLRREEGVERLFGGAAGCRRRRDFGGVQADGGAGGDQRGQQQVLEHGGLPGTDVRESSAQGAGAVVPKVGRLRRKGNSLQERRKPNPRPRSCVTKGSRLPPLLRERAQLAGGPDAGLCCAVVVGREALAAAAFGRDVGVLEHELFVQAL